MNGSSIVSVRPRNLLFMSLQRPYIGAEIYKRIITTSIYTPNFQFNGNLEKYESASVWVRHADFQMLQSNWKYDQGT